jgi:pyruvate formate lyase activating enzyme
MPERVFRKNRCIRCGVCIETCDQHAISLNKDEISTDEEICSLCGACVEICYTGAREIAGKESTVADVMGEIERDIPFYDESSGGVTFSGGEPLMQPQFLLALLRSCRERGIHTALDTCGFSPWEILDDIREHVDLFLYDIKFADVDRHLEFTGVTNELILKNLRALSELEHGIFLRLPIIPGVNDDEKNIREIGELATGLPHLERLDILPYHRAAADKHERLNKIYAMPETCPPSDGRMLDIARSLEGFGIPVKLRG